MVLSNLVRHVWYWADQEGELNKRTIKPKLLLFTKLLTNLFF